MERVEPGALAGEVKGQVSQRHPCEHEQLDAVALGDGDVLDEHGEQPVVRDEHPSEEAGEPAGGQKLHGADAGLARGFAVVHPIPPAVPDAVSSPLEKLSTIARPPGTLRDADPNISESLVYIKKTAACRARGVPLTGWQPPPSWRGLCAEYTI